MSDNTPSVRTQDDTITIAFAEGKPLSAEAVECAVDIDDFGTLIGIEVLDLRKQVGSIKPPSSQAWSYDWEEDALYVRLGLTKYPVTTLSGTGHLLLDGERSVLTFEVTLQRSVL